MSDQTDATWTGVSGFFVAGLTLLFIGLKLTDQIDWSWWWVLAPLWLPSALVLFAVATALAIAALVALLKGEE